MGALWLRYPLEPVPGGATDQSPVLGAIPTDTTNESRAFVRALLGLATTLLLPGAAPARCLPAAMV